MAVTVDSPPSGATWFEVAALEPERFLALRAPIDLHGGRPFDTKGLRPRLYNDSVCGGLPALGACALDHAAAAVREPEAARGAHFGHSGDRCGR